MVKSMPRRFILEELNYCVIKLKAEKVVLIFIQKMRKTKTLHITRNILRCLELGCTEQEETVCIHFSGRGHVP